MTASEEGRTDGGWRGPLYLDASALVKVYVPEEGSDELDRRFTGRRDLVVSDLAVTEIVSALARRCREGDLAAETVSVLHSQILGDLAAGLFRHVGLVAGTHRVAERLLLSARVPLRASDALHLALAMAAEAAGVVTFDRTMLAAAPGAGLVAYPVPRRDSRRRDSH